MIINYLETIIGPLPSYVSYNGDPTKYYEIVRYVVASVVLIFMLALVYKMIAAIFGGFFNK